MQIIEETLEKKFKSYKGSIKSYLAANELLSKRTNGLNGKLNDLQASTKHSDKVNMEAIGGDVIHINVTFRNHAKKHTRSFMRNRGKVTLLRGKFLKR